MTISSEVRTAGPFSGTGAQTNFPFAFKVFATSDLVVVKVDSSLVETTLVLSSDYTVALNGDQNASPGGMITLLVALPAGYSLNVTSMLQTLQPLRLTNAGGFFPQNIEDEFDRLTILIQQTGSSRAIRVPDIGGTGYLPYAANRANKLFTFDALGNPTATLPADGSAAALGISLQQATGATLIGSQQAGTGAVIRLVQDALRDFLTPQQFGAKGDGVTNDIAAFNAMTVAAAATGKAMMILGGTYLLGASWTLGSFPFHVVPLGTVTLHFTGAGQALVLDGSLTAGSGVFGAVFGGDTAIKLKGNAATTDISFLRAIHHSNINVDCKNGVTGCRVNFAVCTDLKVECSNNTDGGFSTTPVNGIVLDIRGTGEYVAACDIFPIIEGVSGTGIVGTFAGFNRIQKGTLEGNLRGLTFSANAFNNTVYMTDFESNGTSDIEDLGAQNNYDSVRAASFATNPNNVVLGAGCNGATFRGGQIRQVSLDAASTQTSFFGVAFSDNGGLGIVGTGSIAARIGCVRYNTSNIVTAKYADVVGEGGQTWTPSITSTGGGAQGAVTLAVGTYCRVGKMLFLEGNISIAKGTLGAGTVSIAGLPVLSRNTANASQFIPMGTWANITLGAGYTHVSLQLLPNAANMTPIKCGTAVASLGLQLTDFPDPMAFGFSGVYETI